jgi:hypothetical protein
MTKSFLALFALAFSVIFSGCDLDKAKFDFAVHDHTPFGPQGSITYFDGIPSEPRIRTGRVERFRVKLKTLKGYGCGTYDPCVRRARVSFSREYPNGVLVECTVLALDDRVASISIGKDVFGRLACEQQDQYFF